MNWTFVIWSLVKIVVLIFLAIMPIVAYAVLARELIPPAVVPQQVLGKQVGENREIALGEGGVPVPDASDVRMLGHDLPLPVAGGRR